jgi:hypothetical protein
MFDLDGNVLWRYYAGAGDIRFSSDGKLIFTTNGGVFDSNGTMLYDILLGWDRSTKIGWINSNAARYIFAIQDTRTTEEINIVEVYRVETRTNIPPIAYIDSISPNSAMQGDTVTFTGHGVDFDGNIVAYNWASSIDGFLSDQASFSTSTLSLGEHTIYFKVQDNNGVWSEEAIAVTGVTIIPEFPPILILPLLIITTLFVALCRRRLFEFTEGRKRKSCM